MGDTFPVLCRFWRILHEVTLRYYRDQPRPREDLSGHITLEFAEYKYRELIAWAETLPPSMNALLLGRKSLREDSKLDER
ncbi:hypothetical protein FOMG_17413 [Fusarium oxysporum f. sp. melonis 26406]|uniref:Uncharacterized protein n=1 Tax=Fusarium oxysporum f. sp. melonis 26406 TaxID=1089452 RepID=W9ZBJ0_FUSOX|nr:hypothetical protein FOMG_17413 [Fusarium oxysporum f. sp. melonis 26406]